MKRFKYSLENVLHYKEQILDSIKAEHGTLLAQIRKKEREIQNLEEKQEQLQFLQQQEEKKKEQVIAAKIDTSRYEKLKDRRQNEYEKAAKKAQELFIEEFASRTARYSQNREVI